MWVGASSFVLARRCVVQELNAHVPGGLCPASPVTFRVIRRNELQTLILANRK
jgi:hypothetical protein